MVATLDILVAGYAADRVASTCTLLRDGDVVAIVDPGMVSDRSLLTAPLRNFGLEPGDVTDVVISHHHPDHTMNIALFPAAAVHDVAATYRDDVWDEREPGPFDLSEHIRLLPTPGHTPQDVSTLVTSQAGLVVMTHLWWSADGPADDPFAPDRELLRRSRESVLALQPHLIVPGHGPAFQPGPETPR